MCEIGSSGSVKTYGGAEVVFSYAPIVLGYRQAITGSRYEKTLSATIQICKDPEKFSEEEMYVRPEEYREIARWLGRRQFLWFHAIDDSEPDRPQPWFRATFTVKRVDAGGRTVGIELNMNTDSPFGYGEEIEENYVFTADNLTKVIEDKNEEPGNIWPEMELVCQTDGSIVLTNKMTKCVFYMKNCVSGELISQSGDTKIIGARMQAVNLLRFPGSSDYEAGKTTEHNGLPYTVNDEGIITIGQTSEVNY